MIRPGTLTKVINMLETAINRVGGYKHVVYCGEPVTNVEYVSILAWDTKLNVGSVGYLPKREIRHGYPIVLGTDTKAMKQLQKRCAQILARKGGD